MTAPPSPTTAPAKVPSPGKMEPAAPVAMPPTIEPRVEPTAPVVAHPHLQPNQWQSLRPAPTTGSIFVAALVAVVATRANFPAFSENLTPLMARACRSSGRILEGVIFILLSFLKAFPLIAFV